MPDNIEVQVVLSPRLPGYVDKEYWYNIQHMGKWFAIKSCCRRCATRQLHCWTDTFGEVKTNMTPSWLIEL